MVIASYLDNRLHTQFRNHSAGRHFCAAHKEADERQSRKMGADGGGSVSVQHRIQSELRDSPCLGDPGTDTGGTGVFSLRPFDGRLTGPHHLPAKNVAELRWQTGD